MIEDQLEIYRSLYIVGGNTERDIDYLSFVESYFAYLSLFTSEIEGYDTYYEDKEFLFNVVNGFNYYQSQLFEDSYIDDIVLSQYITSKYNSIVEKGLSKSINLQSSIENEEDNDLIDDSIFKVSMVCQQMISQGQPSISNTHLIRQMFSNSCNITMTLNKYSGKYRGM